MTRRSEMALLHRLPAIEPCLLEVIVSCTLATLGRLELKCPPTSLYPQLNGPFVLSHVNSNIRVLRVSIHGAA